MSNEFIDVEELFNKLWNEGISDFVESANRKNQSANEFIPAMTRNIRKSLRDGSLIEKINFCNDAKDNGKAAQLRKEGNKMFHPNVKRYIEAIKLYNESITLSEKGSEERALAYGNRSIICLEMQRYEECLENIRLARESNYPERMKEKLDERENSAKQALAKMADEKESTSKDSSEAVEELQLSYPSHENAPQIANCLKLHKNDQYGRHVVTNRKLNVGDVVMIDKPYVTVLDELLRCVRCDFCHAERLFTLIPCEGCSEVMYCSEECLSKAYNKYHRNECGVQRDMRKFFDYASVTSLRTLATAIAIFDNDPQALIDHVSGLDETNVNAFTMDWRHAKPKEIYGTIHVLTTNRERWNCKQFALHILRAIIIHELVLKKTELGSICEANSARANILYGLILRFLQSMQCNMKAIIGIRNGNEEHRYAIGCYSLISMLNHSCAPNVKRITLPDGRCAVFVVKPISDGDQLFDSYGIHHLTLHRTMRQHLLRSLFLLKCTCEACVLDYPMLRHFAMNNPIRRVSEALSCACYRERVSKLMKYLRSCLNDVTRWKWYPNADLCFAQTHFILSLLLLYTNISVDDE